MSGGGSEGMGGDSAGLGTGGKRGATLVHFYESLILFLDNRGGPFSNAFDTTFGPLTIELRCRVVVNGKHVVAKLHRKGRQRHCFGKLRRIRNSGIPQKCYQSLQLVRSLIFD